MFHVSVALPSGRSENFAISRSSKVGDLRILAQKAFQLGFLRLAAADHSVVDPTKSLQDAGLEDGDHLTAIAAVTALKSKIGLKVSSSFKQHMVHLLRSWRMGLL